MGGNDDTWIVTEVGVVGTDHTRLVSEIRADGRECSYMGTN